ncbi:MAG: hypothetical protein MJZ94_04940 [Bacteroidales bacterium]|nr:hypothetical protein [Bacteroidales bacterium]
MEKEKWSLFGPRPWLSFILFSGIILVGDCSSNITIPLISGEAIDWNYFWKEFFADTLAIAFFALSFCGSRYLAYKTTVFKKMTDRDALLKILVAIIIVLSFVVGAIGSDWLFDLLGL